MTYSTKFVALNGRLFLIAAAETTLVDKLRKLLFHQLLNFGHSLFQTFLCRAGDMEVKGGIRRCRHVLVGVVVSAGCDIFERKQ